MLNCSGIRAKMAGCSGENLSKTESMIETMADGQGKIVAQKEVAQAQDAMLSGKMGRMRAAPDEGNAGGRHDEVAGAEAGCAGRSAFFVGKTSGCQGARASWLAKDATVLA